MKVYILRFEEDIEEIFLSMSDMAEYELARFQEFEYREFLYNVNSKDMSIEDAIKDAREYAMQEFTGYGHWYTVWEVIE